MFRKKKGLAFSGKMSQSFISLECKELALESGDGTKKMGRRSTMYQKKQELAMNRENPKKIYTIETKIVIAFSAAQVGRKKRG